MDRIVIIGNGFDLAHGLKTGYSDFFDYLRDSIAVFEGKNSGYLIPKIYGFENGEYRRHIHRKTGEDKICKWICVSRKGSKPEYELTTNPESNSIYFKSLFSDYNGKGYWSDLEHHYFKVLNRTNNATVSSGSKQQEIERINEEFEYLKDLLEDYLKTEVEDKIRNPTVRESFVYQMLRENKRLSHEFKNNYFVTFNYTYKYLDEYLNRFQSFDNRIEDKFNSWPIHIHGELKNKSNPIILGYGDENSEDYKKIELSGNNELLKNFKTFQYLRTSKYTQVLGLLESSKDIYFSPQ